ncbi:sigma-70 family RNA polymerase sigma factor [Acidimangrovimonas pyrenivorans]|uniref:Sigma-70 family RNA polymerase sigma factor n=1 Tax=Acidimangrovimonas pyrenivorans TaxID=2030798 RepID=A0ABV7AH18_9RHOB
MTPDPISGLLARVAAQDRAAFGELYHAASAKVFGVLLQMLRDRAEAEEALEEVFARVWLRAGRFDGARGRGMTWIIAVARADAIDRLRARPEPAPTAEDAAAVDMPEPAPAAEVTVVAAGRVRRIGDCIDALDPDRAEAVRGAYIGGLSYAQLARRHDVPQDTIRTWLQRGLIRLRECLEA